MRKLLFPIVVFVSLLFTQNAATQCQYDMNSDGIINFDTDLLLQLSEYGTGITQTGTDEEKEIAGAMINIEHGDRLRFGNRHFVISLVPQYGAE